jgi:DNA-binding ferritin-like protein
MRNTEFIKRTGTNEAQEGKAINMAACAEFIGALLHSATVTHFQHLQVEGAGAHAAHRALGDYYDDIVGVTDSVAENIQGAYDVIIKPYPAMYADATDEPLAYLKKLREYVRAKRAELPQDSEIQNEVDSIATLINRTCYRLQRLK